MKATFTTNVISEVRVNATGLPVPAEVVAALGTQKRPKVIVNLNGYTYRTTVGIHNAGFVLPLSAERRLAAGLAPGDPVQVTIELDLEPRTVAVPDDLAAALAERPGAAEAFDALSYTNRKEYVRQVETAKALETRQRRIAGIVAKMVER